MAPVIWRRVDKPKLDTPPNPLALILFFGVLGAGVLFVAYSLYVDVGETGTQDDDVSAVSSCWSWRC